MAAMQSSAGHLTANDDCRGRSCWRSITGMLGELHSVSSRQYQKALGTGSFRDNMLVSSKSAACAGLARQYVRQGTQFAVALSRELKGFGNTVPRNG